MPALVLLRRQLLIASDDVPLFALPAALFHSAWTIVLIVTLALYQRHPICRDEGDYLPFLAGGAAAFTISSALEWSLFSVGLTGTPLETHARRAVPLLLYLHTLASVAELAFAAYGAHLLHVDTRLCTAWSPRPLAAALVGTSWAVIALNGLLTALALNPWHGLGLVEAWEARLLWLSRLLCCRPRLLTQARMPDREPALRRIAQLTSHLLQHVDLTLSDVATAMILVAAAQRERRRRALRDAMVAAAAAHSALMSQQQLAQQKQLGGPLPSGQPGGSGSGWGAPTAAAAAAAAAVAVAEAPVQGAGLSGGGDAPAGPKMYSAGAGGLVPSGLSSVAPLGCGTSVSCRDGSGGGAAGGGGRGGGVRGLVAALHGGDEEERPGAVAAAAAAARMAPGGVSPFLAIQQHQTHQPQFHGGRQPPRARFLFGQQENDGTELEPLLHHHHPPPAPALQPTATTAASTPAAVAASAAGPATARVLISGGGADPAAASHRPLANLLLGPAGSASLGAASSAFAALPPLQPNALAPLQPSAPARTGVSSDGVGARSPSALLMTAASEVPAAAAVEEEEDADMATLPSPSHALALLHPPVVHITPAGMEEHLEELVGELVGELAAEVAEAEEDAGAGEATAAAPGGAAADGAGVATELGADVDLDLRGSERGVAGEGAGGGATFPGGVAALRRTGSAAAAPSSAAAAPSPAVAALRKRIGDAALAAAFAAEREMVDRATLQEAVVYGRYAAAIYGSHPPDGPGKSSAWHLGGDGGDGDAAAAAAGSGGGGGGNGSARVGVEDQVAAWRRSHGSSAPDQLLASILSSASQCTEHVVHVNTHNSTEGYLPYMVCLDKPTRSVVIAIRGTFSAEDIVTDCLCEPFDIRHLLSDDGTVLVTGATTTTTTTAAATTTITTAIAGAAAGAAAAAAAPAAAAATALTGASSNPLAGREPTGEEARPAATAAAATAGAAGIDGGGGGGFRSEEPVLVHAGIWAAADVIWEDLQELRLLHILLPLPGAGSPAAVASEAAAAAAPGDRPTARGSGGGTGSGTGSGSRTSTDGVGAYSPPDAARVGPTGSLQQQQQQQLQSQQRPPPPPHPQFPQRRRRAVSLDEDRVAAAAAWPKLTHGSSAAAAHFGQQLVPPPQAVASSDPWIVRHSAAAAARGAARRPASFAARHPHSNLPRLVSAERQATLPHGGGLAALLQRHRLQWQPPPPPPAAALLPSLVLSYHPPGRETPMPPSGGGGGSVKSSRCRELPPSLLRRRASPSTGGGNGERSGARRAYRGFGAGGGSTGGRSSSGDDDNDPRAPLLLSSQPAAGGGSGGGCGGNYSPVGAAAAATLSPAVGAATFAGAGASISPHWGAETMSRRSIDLGFAGWRGSAGAGLEAAAYSPSRRAPAAAAAAAGSGRPCGSPLPPQPGAAPADRWPLRAPTAQPLPDPAIAAYGGGGFRGGGGRRGYVAASLGASQYARRPAYLPPGRLSYDDGDGAGVGAGGPCVHISTPSTGARDVQPAPEGFFGHLRRVAWGLLGAALPRGGVARRVPPQPPQQQPQPQEEEEELSPAQRARPHQRRLGWLAGAYGARPASASDGGGSAHMPYMSLPRTELEVEADRVGAGGGEMLGFGASSRRWQSAGGGGGGADGDAVDGRSFAASPDYLGASRDLEVDAGAAARYDHPGARYQQLQQEDEDEPLPPGTATEGAAPGTGPPLRLPAVDCSGWRLVVTGHSLGAGAAALLALRLRSALPHVEVRCWAFAPPGSLASPALSAALRPFTVSVVAGKDLIPRLSLNTMERYRDEMITALARCRCTKARVLVGSFSRRNRLRRAAHLLLPYSEIPAQARQLLRAYHGAVQRAGRLPELHPPGKILYLQPSARAGDGRRASASSAAREGPVAAAGPADGGGALSGPHYRPVWVSARELLSEGILASTRMLVDHSLTLCTLPALDEILRA